MKKTDYSRFYDPFPGDIDSIERTINKSDNVLDVGGWWKPLNRANVMLDALPYESRGRGGSIGSQPEQYSNGTWVQLDICRNTWPFKDKEFDFVHCGQTLEDVRDPIFVCKEMIRVAKRGVITTPTIWIECQMGIDAYPDSVHYRGFDKHKWMVEHSSNELRFIPKLNSLMSFEYVDQKIVNKYITKHRIWSDIFFWENSFSFSESVFQGFTELKPILVKYFAQYNYEKISQS